MTNAPTTHRIRLLFRELSEIAGSDGMAVALLTDENEQRALSVICDKQMTDQMAIRLNAQPNRRILLPEVLVEMLLSDGKTANNFELYIYDIADGQYQVSLLNRETLALRSIRASDAVLLSYISHIPLYIDEVLMLKQSSAFSPLATGVSIPINTIDTDRLNAALEKAVSEENYRLASLLQQEIERRKEHDGEKEKKEGE